MCIFTVRIKSFCGLFSVVTAVADDGSVLHVRQNNFFQLVVERVFNENNKEVS